MSDAWDASSISREKRASLLAVRLKRKKDDGWSLADSSKKRKSRAPAADSADDDSFSPRDVAAATSMVLCRVPEYNRMILVGSDCVGLGGDAFGRKLLGITHRCVDAFASELDFRTRSAYVANHPGCLLMYENCSIQSRALRTTLNVDLYAVGPPCGPWSAAGTHGGLGDAGGVDGENRGAVLLDCVAYIVNRKPKCFIIEEVLNITQGKNKTIFNSVLDILKSIEFRGQPLYHIEDQILNTCVHGGIPQHRERVYVVGVWRCFCSTKFAWPDRVESKRLSSFLGPNTHKCQLPTAVGPLTKLVDNLETLSQTTPDDPTKVMYAIDIHSGPNRRDTMLRELSPTITRHRAAHGGYFLTSWQRMMTTSEIARLQGFPPDIKRGMATDKQLRQMLGNAMTVSVVARVQRMVLAAARFISLEDVPDPCMG